MAKKSGVHVSATIPTELHEVLQEYRWEQKIDKFTDVIRDALENFAIDNLDYAPASEDTPKA